MIPFRFVLYIALTICLFAKAGWTAPVVPRTNSNNKPPKRKLLRQEDFLNQILSTDSDEDVFFGRTWSDLFLHDEDDESVVMVVSDVDDGQTAKDEQIIVLSRAIQSFESDPDEDMDYFSDT